MHPPTSPQVLELIRKDPTNPMVAQLRRRDRVWGRVLRRLEVEHPQVCGSGFACVCNCACVCARLCGHMCAPLGGGAPAGVWRLWGVGGGMVCGCIRAWTDEQHPQVLGGVRVRAGGCVCAHARVCISLCFKWKRESGRRRELRWFARRTGRPTLFFPLCAHCSSLAM